MLRWCDLVMVFFHRKAHFLHDRHHFGAEIITRIDRSNREITTLYPWAVPGVSIF